MWKCLIDCECRAGAFDCQNRRRICQAGLATSLRCPRFSRAENDPPRTYDKVTSLWWSKIHKGARVYIQKHVAQVLSRWHASRQAHGVDATAAATFRTGFSEIFWAQNKHGARKSSRVSKDEWHEFSSMLHHKCIQLWGKRKLIQILKRYPAEIWLCWKNILPTRPESWSIACSSS